MSDGDHFRMGGGIFELLALVSGGGDDPIVVYDDGPDGDFALIVGLLRHFQGFKHPEGVRLKRIFDWQSHDGSP